jgi:hypothetical protein
MPTALPARNIFDGTANPITSTMKTAMGSLRDFLADLLGTTGVAADARTALDVGFASSTKALFGQASAPTGWTQVTTDNATNRMLRVVNTAGAGIGGGDSPILNNIVVTHTHTYSGTTGNQNASHTHTDSGHQHPSAADVSYSPTVAQAGSQGFANIGYNTGYGYAALGTETANHGHAFSGTTAAPAGAGSGWAPRYLDLILCSKN